MYTDSHNHTCHFSPDAEMSISDLFTYAVKAKKLFEHAGLKATLVKSDSSATNKGCTYGVNIDARFLYDAVSILKNYGIEYSVETAK